MPTTPYQALPYPALADAPNGPVGLQNLAVATEPKLVMVFATTAARTAAITAPTEGMLTWLSDVDRYEFYDGTGWRTLPPARTAGQVLQSVAQSLANNTPAPITFDAETYDPLNWHSTVSLTTRVTPNIAGYYLAGGKVSFTNTSGGGVRLVYLRLNGTTEVDGSAHQTTSDASVQYFTPSSPALLHVNGTTDYFELMAMQNSGGAINTLVSTGSNKSCLWWFLLAAG